MLGNLADARAIYWETGNREGKGNLAWYRSG